MNKLMNRIARGSFAGMLTFGRFAHADCASPLISSDEAVIARMGSSDAVQAHAQLYQNGYYNMLSDYGWGEMPLRQEEFDSHFYGTFLARHGVVSENPPVRQKANGEWEYDPDALVFAPTFHRSWDDYGWLSWDITSLAETRVDPGTGGPAFDLWGPMGVRTVVSGGTGTGVVDSFPDFPTASAWHRSIWDVFKDPDNLLEYNCKTFDDRRGFVAVAQMIVHENWHDTNSPNHVDPQGSCTTSGTLVCDTYVWDMPTSARVYNGISRLSGHGVGAYQIDQRFTCDLVEAPADWIPIQTQLVANEYFHKAASVSRFVNLEGTGGRLPYTCGLPEDVLSVSADDHAFCPGTTQLRCNIVEDCGVERPNHAWFCEEGCCAEHAAPT